MRWLPQPARPGYTDQAALNDIHALLTTTTPAGHDDGQALLGDIAAIVTRSGRPMVRARDIDATITHTPTGWPVARVDAGTTTVTVRQEPAGPGLLIDIATSSQVGRDDLTVTLNGDRLHPAPHGGHCA
jgi:hypothetical protein